VTEKIRVMIVDESVVYRQFLSEALSSVAGMEVVTVAATGKIALARLAQNPVDLLLFDVEMKTGDALGALKEIRATYPEVGLVLLSGLDSNSAGTAIQALEMGALELLAKPNPSGSGESLAEFRGRLESMVRAYRGKKHARLAKRLTEGKSAKELLTKVRAEQAAGPAVSRKKGAGQAALVEWHRPARIDVIAVAVSTGGPKALGEVIPQLPGDLGVPVLLVQHMPPLFTEALAGSLNKKSQLEVSEAKAGERVRPNRVYIAPGGKHMVVEPDPEADNEGLAVRIALSLDPPVNSCRPAADVLFRSIAEVYGGHTLAVIMTGMGNDGAQGVREMKIKGCYCLSQSEESCVVYGMPRAVDEAGLADEQVGLGQLAGRMSALVKRIRDGRNHDA